MHYYAYLVLVMNEVEKIQVMGVAYAVMLYYEFFFPGAYRVFLSNFRTIII